MVQNKTFLIFGSIAAVILGLLSVYFLFLRVGPDGEVRTLREFLPFGRAPEGTIIRDQGDGPTDDGGDGPDIIVPDDTASGPKPVLEQVTTEPISGAFIMLSDDGQVDPKVRYMDRATGHTYEYEVGSRQVPDRLTNTTIPRVYEAMWVEGGEAVIARFLANDRRTIRSFYGKITSREQEEQTDQDNDSDEQSPIVSLEPGILEGIFLPENITAMAVSPDGESVFYVANTDTGGSVLATSDTDGSSRNVLHTSELREWLVEWPRSSEISLATKPSYGEIGYAFTLSTSGTMRSILTPTRGLTTLADQISKYMMYGGQYESGYVLNVYNRQENNGQTLSLDTIPEKCVWSETEDALFCAVPRGGVDDRQPDAWYQGTRSFNDDIWKIDLKAGSTKRLILLREEANEPIDAVDLQISKDDQLLVFRNKIDGTLWSLTFPEDEHDKEEE